MANSIRRQLLKGSLLSCLPVATLAVTSDVRILMVGVAEYANRDIAPLKGPGNDIELLRSQFLARGVRSSNFKVLCNARSIVNRPWVSGPPTRDNILNAIRNLAASAAPDRLTIFYYAGHGCRTPAKRGTGNVEPDGLDEVILPTDTGRWSGSISFVENAIRDNEIGQALAQAVHRGPTLAIFDSCYANTLTKSIPNKETTFRSVLPEALGIPRIPVNTTKAVPDRDRSPEPIAMYAAPEDVRAAEMPLPGPNGVRRTYGAFSWLLAQSLADPSVKTVRHWYDGAAARRHFDLPDLVQNAASLVPEPILEDNRQVAKAIALPA